MDHYILYKYDHKYVQHNVTCDKARKDPKSVIVQDPWYYQLEPRERERERRQGRSTNSWIQVSVAGRQMPFVKYSSLYASYTIRPYILAV